MTIITNAIKTSGLRYGSCASETILTGRRIASLVDLVSSPPVDPTATIVVAISLCQGSHSQEEQTQAEHHRSLHVWIVQMVLRWRDPNK